MEQFASLNEHTVLSFTKPKDLNVELDQNNQGRPVASHVIPSLYTHLSPLQKLHNSLIKRAMDVILSSLLILLIFPWFMPIAALLIKLESRGPIFFLQKRHRAGCKVFTCIKLRTMYVNADADTVAAYENDPRITPLGLFFRKNHLDELPQLINVWLGTMSLIGPRPYMISDSKRCEHVIAQYHLRHSVKPGITGLAQSLGHYGYWENHQAIEQRFALDLQYVRQWSVKMDILIVARTIRLFSKRLMYKN